MRPRIACSAIRRHLPRTIRTRCLSVVVGVASLLMATAPATAAPAVDGVWATAGDRRVTISWEPVPGATAYRVYESTSAGTTGALVASVPAPATSVHRTGRTNGTQYFYTVRSWDGSIESGNPPASVTTSSETLPQRRWSTSGCSATIDGVIYLFGGDVSGGATDRIVAYDVATDTATTLVHTLPASRAHCAATEYEGTAFIFGGTSSGWSNSASGRTNIWQFTPGVGVVARGAVLPSARWGLSAATLDDRRIYLFGGSHNGTDSNQVLRYDPVADTNPTSVATLPSARSAIGTGVVWGRAFTLGGVSSSNTYTNNVSQFTTAPSRTNLTTLPSSRGYLGTNAVNEIVYGVGGYDGGYRNSIWQLDPTSGSASAHASTLPSSRSDTAVAQVRGALYVLGGDASTVSNQIVRFVPGGQARATPNAPSATGPGGGVATASGSSVTLSWSAGSDARHYRVFRSTDAGQRGSLIEEAMGTPNGTRTSIVDGDLATGTYHYTVEAVGFDGRLASAVATATVFVDATPPTNPTTGEIYDLSLTFSDDVDHSNLTTSLSGSWDPGSDADSSVQDYEWCFAASDRSGQATCSAIAGTDTSGSGNTTRTVTATASASVTNGSSVWLCVRTRDEADNVATTWSCSDGVTIDRTAPTNPSSAAIFDLDLTATADLDTASSATALSASWGAGSDAGSGIAGYSACFSTVSSGCTPVAGTSQIDGIAPGDRTASATASGLSSGVTYYTCVRAVDRAGNTASSWRCSDGFAWTASMLLSVTGHAPDGTGPGTSIDFGTMLGGDDLVAELHATVTTDNPAGYELQLADDDAATGAFSDGAAASIPWTGAGSVAAPGAWSGTGVGIAAWGGAETPDRWCQGGQANCTASTDADLRWAALTTSDQLVSARTSATAGETTRLPLRVALPVSQQPASYSARVRVTAVARP